MTQATALELYRRFQDGEPLSKLATEQGINQRLLLLEWRQLDLSLPRKRSDPTAEEIREECLRFQLQWSPAVEQTRWVGRRRLD